MLAGPGVATWDTAKAAKLSTATLILITFQKDIAQNEKGIGVSADPLKL
jgi:hypothetical protein|tara:strand:+ start:188 stop:334 length:147 start_codon:yes stop_codon:yes gene_type:complete